MNNISTIAKKEIRSYFYSPAAYILLGFFLLLTGWLYGSHLFLIKEASLRNIFQLIPLILIFLVPAITMRSISEERNSGTIELLCTSPVRDSEIILGKFYAAFFLLSTAIIFTLFYGIIISFISSPDWGIIIAAYIGLLLMGAAYSAIGIFGSTISKNQIVGFVFSFFIILIFYLIDKFLYLFPAWLGSILQYISIDFHFQNIARGVIDSRDVIYYLSVIVLFLFFARQSLTKHKYL
ncbi:MAG: ABC transporter permease [Candidatus Cloacimonadota bacterium]|nr:ABC transporter permease [Candidatus Cloacimonadota bacterium]